MAIAFGAIGTKATQTTGATPIAIAYPASPGAGDMAVAGRGTWNTVGATPTAETGWTRPTASLFGGNAGGAVDNHRSHIVADVQELTGSESGSVNFDIAGTVDGAVGIMLRYTKGAGETWDTIQGTTGDDASHGANASVTGSGTLDLAPGDWVTVVKVSSTDSSLTITSPAITASGITFGTTTRRTSGAGSTAGQDGNIEVFDAEVTSGSGTVAPVLTFTTATSQSGPATFLRLRVTASSSPGTITTVVGDAAADGGSGDLTGAGTLTSLAGDAAAAGGSSTLTGAATMTTTAGDAVATGGVSDFGVPVVLTTAVGDVTVAGGTSTFAGGGTITSLAGDATAAGGSSTFSGGVTIATSSSDAAAAGGSGTFTAGATFSTIAGDVTAAGGVATFTAGGAGTFATETGAATAEGGTTIFTVPATLETLAAQATAEGQDALFTAGATFLTEAGDVLADGGTGAFVVGEVGGGVDIGQITATPPPYTAVATAPAYVVTANPPAHEATAAAPRLISEAP